MSELLVKVRSKEEAVWNFFLISLGDWGTTRRDSLLSMTVEAESLWLSAPSVRKIVRAGSCGLAEGRGGLAVILASDNRQEIEGLEERAGTDEANSGIGFLGDSNSVVFFGGC